MRTLYELVTMVQRFDNPPSFEDLSRFTRLEIITDKGREYVNMSVKELKASAQDDGRTLKLFVK